MRITPTHAGRSGFTLIEVLAAMTMLVFIFMSSVGAITIGFRLLEDARMNTLASQVLQSEMENLRLKNWIQLCALPSSGTFDIETSLEDASFEKFTCQRDITDYHTDMKQVVLTLTWNSMDGRAHTRRYRTLIGNDGLNDYYYRKL